MPTIFMDESGYTGEDLMNPDQIFFTLATLNMSERESQEYKTRFFKQIQAPELKYIKLVENRRQKLILDFLTEIAQKPELVKIHIIHKRYYLVRKIVQLIVEPSMVQGGIDLRIKGRDFSLTHSMYTSIPQLAGQYFFEDLLRRFQFMMKHLNHESYHQFFDPLFDEKYPQLTDKKEQEKLDQLLGYIKLGHTTIGYDLIDHLENTAQSLGISRSRPLDPALPTALALLQSWQRDVTEEIALIHDASSRMAEVINLLHTYVHPFPPDFLVRSSTNKVPFSIVVGEIYARDSKKWVGLQLADILAGATKHVLTWTPKDKRGDEQYIKVLGSIISLFRPSINKPVRDPTPEDFEECGLTQDEAQMQANYSEQLLTFHKIRRYGYFRMM